MIVPEDSRRQRPPIRRPQLLTGRGGKSPVPGPHLEPPPVDATERLDRAGRDTSIQSPKRSFMRLGEPGRQDVASACAAFARAGDGLAFRKPSSSEPDGQTQRTHRVRNSARRGVSLRSRPRLPRAWTAAGFALAMGLMSGSAAATPGNGVSSRILAQGVTDRPVEVRTTVPTNVVARTITIAPGGATGWHYHPGNIVAVVVSGTLTRTLAKRDGTCTMVTSGPGDAFVEEGGNRHVHNGRNLGRKPVVLHVTYILPKNSPTSVDAKDPGCAH